MSVRQYIGARYTTKIYENSLDPSSAEWEQGTFDPLVMVTWQNSTYLSKKQVPGSVGNPADNPNYWVCTGYYNGQIMQLQNQINDIRMITDNFITPDMFGAAGDGIIDDTIAIQAAITKCANTGKCFYLPNLKTYLLSDTIVLNDPAFDIVMDGTLKYNKTSGAAIQINSMHSRHVKFNMISDGDMMKNNTALEITGEVFANIIDITRIIKFTYGIHYSDTSFNGMSWNTLNIMSVYNALVGILVDGNCWFNENTIIGGNIKCGSDTPYTNTVSVKFDSSVNYYHNNNYILHPCFESMDTGFECLYGRLNNIISARVEDCDYICKFANTSDLNKVTYECGTSTTDVILNDFINEVTCESVPNVFQIYSSPRLDIAPITNWGDCYIDDTLVCYGTGVFVRPSNLYQDGVHGLYNTSNPMGVLIDLNDTNEIGLKCDIESGSYFTYHLIMFDQSGNKLTDSDITPNNYYYYDASDFNNQGGWRANAGISSNQLRLIPLSPKVKKVFVGIESPSLYNISIFGSTKFLPEGSISSNFKAPTIEKIDMAPGLLTQPTTAVAAGTIVLNADGTNPSVGWKYTGSVWNAL